MATIKYYLHPGAAAEIETADSVAASLLKRWPSGAGVPQGLRVYRGCTAARACDVTENVTELLTASDNTYTVTVEPGTLTTALVIISVVISVAGILLAPSVPGAPANANRNQQSANNFLGARTNEPRVNQRSADIRGTQPNAYPDLLQVPYRRFRNGVEYEYVYAQVSEGYCQTENWRDGGTQFNRVIGSQLAVYGPGTSPLSGTPQLVIGGTPSELLYALSQSSEITGTTLVPPNQDSIGESTYTIDSFDDTITTDDPNIDFTTFLQVGGTITLTDFWGWQAIVIGTPTKYDRLSLDGTYEISSVSEKTIGIVPTGNWNLSFTNPNGEVVREAWYNGDEPAGWYLEEPVEPSTRYEFNPRISGVGGANLVVADCSGFDRLLINIVATNGLYKDDGVNRVGTNVVAEWVIRELDANGIRTGNFIDGTTLVKPNPEGVSQSTGESTEVEIPYALAEVEISRTSPTDKDFSGTVVDEIKWRDLYLMNDMDTIDTSYATTVHAEIKQTESALRVKERKLNARVTRLVETYSGGTFSGTEDTASDMFADVVASIWRDPLFGRGEDDEVDWENLYDVQDQLVTYFGGVDVCRVGYTFDSDKITAEQAIKLICNAVNVEPYRIGNVMYFWPELPQSQSSMQFGHRFKHPGTDQIDRLYGPEDDHTGVELTYFDEITESFEVLTRGSDVNPLKIELSGCITARGAQVRVDREWNKLRYSRVRQSFDATALARMVTKGMRIDAVDNTRYEPFNGEVRGVDGLTLRLSQSVTLETPTDYSIVLTRSDGSVDSIGISAQPAPDRVTLSAAPSEPPYTGRERDRTTYSLGTDDMRTKRAMLVREVITQRYNRITVRCVNYDDRYYQNDNV